MKITCQSCQAKYTIADEKVAGKTVKIKCKKCGASIVVHGAEHAQAGYEAAPAAGAPAGHGYEEDGETRIFQDSPASLDEWTVNVADDDQRTMNRAQIAEACADGSLTSETYVWKDGMPDWLPLGSVPELAPYLRNAAAPEPAEGGLGSTVLMDANASAAGPYGAAYAASPPAVAMAPLAAAPSGGASQPAARRAGSRSGVDLFGAARQERERPPEPAPGPSLDRQVGERNENSVLFSLSALTAAEGAAKAAKTSAPDPVLGLPSPAPARNNGRNEIDDIMNLGGGGLAAPMLAPPPLTAPVIEPPQPQAPPSSSVAPGMPASVVPHGMIVTSAPPPRRSSAGMIMGVIGGLALVAGIGFFVMRPAPPPPAPAATNEQPAATAAQVQPAATQTTAAATTAPATTAPPSEAAAVATGAAAATGAVTGAPPASTLAGGVGGPFGAGAQTGKPGLSGPMPPTTGKQPDKQPDKAAAAPEKPPEKPPEKAAEASGGSKEFSRGAAASALGSAAGAARGCKKPDGPTGSGRVKVTFAPSGNVTSAVVEGPPFAGTPVGGCIASAFRSARVPPFDGGPVTVSKSFSVN